MRSCVSEIIKPVEDGDVLCIFRLVGGHTPAPSNPLLDDLLISLVLISFRKDSGRW